MDEQKVKGVKRNNFKIISGVAGILLVVAGIVYGRNSDLGVNKNELVLSQVKVGDMSVMIDGYGKLESKNTKLLTSLTKATVESILLKPGAVVTPESVILKLSNSELEQELYEEQQKFKQVEASYRQIKLSQQKDLLDESTKFAKYSSDLRSVELENSIYIELMKTGSISKLVFNKSKIVEQELNSMVELQKQRTEKLKLIHKEELQMAQERVKQQRGRLDIAEKRLKSLTVVAGISGVLLKLPVEVGQSILSNQEVGFVGSDKDLIAVLHVPQGVADQVRPGQTAIIDTRKDKIIGTVNRVNPLVVNNTVEVEIYLSIDLPQSARVQMNVDGIIKVEELTNVLMVDRPANVRPFEKTMIYKMDSSGDLASPVEVKVGHVAVNKIQLIPGEHIKKGDFFIVSDMSKYYGKEI